jgi:huntingtin-interacting protein 1-related protein
LSKLDQANADLERLREEKDQEIEILNEGMDEMLKKVDELQQV